MAAIAVSRSERFGCRSGVRCNWVRMSGEALTNTEAGPLLPVTAIEDWVRAEPWKVPARIPEQLRQLQFHCGNPPPAADPSTWIFTWKTSALVRAESAP
jgi:hypothetical protein